MAKRATNIPFAPAAPSYAPVAAAPLARRRSARLAAIALVCALAATLYPTLRAGAHVYVLPARSAPGAYEHYVVYVHAERPRVPSVGLQLLIPPDVVVDATRQDPGWRVARTVREGRVTGLTWSGGAIPPGQYATYGFAARNPRSGNSITWRAVQRYADGTAVVWDGAPGSAQPAAVTVLGGGADASPGVAAPPALSGLAALSLAAGLLGLVCGLTSLGVLIVALRHRLLS